MAEIKAEPGADQVVLEARARQSGLTFKSLTEMREPALGEAAGRAIFHIHKRERARELWKAYTGLTGAEAAYAKTYLGMSLHAKTAELKYLVDQVEARADDRPDLRDEEERARDASNRWMSWRGMVMQLDRKDQVAIQDVSLGRVEPMDGGQVTAQGKRFVEALERLAAVVERKGK